MFSKIIVAIDRSPNGKAVFDAGLALAKATKANLMVLHILSNEEKNSPQIPTLVTLEYHPLHKELLEDYWKQWQTYKEQGIDLLRSYIEQATNAGVSTEFTQNSGNPSRNICEVAQGWGADLIVIGRRGHSGLSELILGSVSNYVFHHAPCSVHVVHTPAALKSEAPVVNQVQVGPSNY
ncbi:universal stress protein [Nostoc sp. 'Lobaria pulmonaria (5183) cyanobiont']|uniref:universal stress protein n=1 Tax=Nostoc sp. 'Lobaria pulmonaria (5183) cyanobiont' TaxID=1618022 RepID=UPI000CF35824|nr:universal stress protein [Nostoc sp. 'Lobaria pulmonaria (5183) cyanobiont']AVH68976.1 universal stress protein UspA [Nostoc sp. 'Lobaria pulmonaria (5183) cyanobiont']